VLPAPAKTAAKRLAVPADLLYRWSYRRRTGDPRPAPPLLLRSRVGSGASIPVYHGAGLHLANALDEALRAQGRSLYGEGAVLDFGCGCGRLVSALAFPPGPTMDPESSLHGCDVDAQAIAWASRHLPRATFAVNSFEPPLPYDAEAFDVLVGSSIFTHLTESRQDAWLREVDRVLAPGGIALLTVAGLTQYSASRRGELPSNSRDFSRRLLTLPALDERGFVFEPYVRTLWNRRDFPGIDDAYGMAFHSPDYIQERWGRHFRVLEQREAATNHLQDLVALGKL
jgi:SAM-dependent methyltransferase